MSGSDRLSAVTTGVTAMTAMALELVQWVLAVGWMPSAQCHARGSSSFVRLPQRNGQLNRAALHDLKVLFHSQKWTLKEVVGKRGQENCNAECRRIFHEPGGDSRGFLMRKDCARDLVRQHVKDIESVRDATEIDGPAGQQLAVDTEKGIEDEAAAECGQGVSGHEAEASSARVTQDVEDGDSGVPASRCQHEIHKAQRNGWSGDPIVKEETKKDSGCEVFKLDEGVVPNVILLDARLSEKEQPDIRDQNERNAHVGEGTAGAVFDDPRNEEIELLLDGDAPEDPHRIEGRGGDKHAGPVAEEKDSPDRPRDAWLNHRKYSDTKSDAEPGEVERPNSKNAADVELAGMNLAGCLTLSQQKFGDEEGTESKKEAESESRSPCGVEEYLRHTTRQDSGRNRS